MQYSIKYKYAAKNGAVRNAEIVVLDAKTPEAANKAATDELKKKYQTFKITNVIPW